MKKGFWSWCWITTKRISHIDFKSTVKHPMAEWVFGWIYLVVSTLILACLQYPPWLLAVTIPVGIIVLLHSWWRGFVKNEKGG